VSCYLQIFPFFFSPHFSGSKLSESIPFVLSLSYAAGYEPALDFVVIVVVIASAPLCILCLVGIALAFLQKTGRSSRTRLRIKSFRTPDDERPLYPDAQSASSRRTGTARPVQIAPRCNRADSFLCEAQFYLPFFRSSFYSLFLPEIESRHISSLLSPTLPA